MHQRSHLVTWLGPLTAVLAIACAPAAPSAGPAAAPLPASAQAADAPAPAATAPAPAARPAPQKVKVAYTPTVASAGLFLAISHGYFAEEGLEPELVPFDSGEQALPVLATGQVEVSTLGLSAGLFGAIARGAELKIVAGNSSNEPGSSSSALLVRKELVDSGALRDLADLRGRTVAVVSQTGGLSIDVSRGLQSAGLSDADVTWQVLPFPDQLPALANGVIDVGAETEPFVARAVATGIGVRWKGADELYPYHQLTVIAYAPSFVRDEPDAAARFLAAYLRGARDFVDAFKQGRDRAGVIGVLTEYTPIKEPSLFEQMVPSGIDPDGNLNLEGLEYDQGWYLERGYLREKIDLGRLVDFRYREAALQRLGRYAPRP
jgi:NitT/TauT family transport system substrate-binding protein